MEVEHVVLHLPTVLLRIVYDYLLTDEEECILYFRRFHYLLQTVATYAMEEDDALDCIAR
jgi:hypothetical protein